MACITRVAACYDVSRCLCEGIIFAVPRPAPGRIIRHDPADALSAAEALRADDVRYFRAELLETEDLLRKLRLERNRLLGCRQQAAGEINRLEALRFRIE